MVIQRRIVFIVLVAAGAAALVAAARHGPPFREVSDGAIIEISTLDALNGKLLVGPYSRFGWHHPGPLFFYLLAPWYWAAGLHTAGAQAGALAINLAAVAVVTSVLLRAAKPIAVVVVAAAVAAYVIRAGDMIVSVWNPHVIILPLAAFVIVSAALAASGRTALFLWWAAMASFLVQTHLATAPIVVIVSMPVLVARRDELKAIWPRVVVLIGIVWLPVSVEQATHRPGNLTRIAAFFFTGGDAPSVQPLSLAAQMWASAVTSAFRSDFVVAMGFEINPGAGWANVAVTAVVIALLMLAVTKARRDTFTWWLAALCAISTLVALVATTRIRGHIVDHEIFWMSALGVLDCATIVAVFAERLVDSAHGIATSVAVSVMIACVIVGAIGMRHVLQRERGPEDRNVDVVTDAINEHIRSVKPRRLLVNIEPPVWTIAAGALLQLDKQGNAFAVDNRWVTMFGERFARNGAEDAEVTITGSPLQPVVVARIRE